MANLFTQLSLISLSLATSLVATESAVETAPIFIRSFEISYLQEHAGLPNLKELKELPIVLGDTDTGFTAASDQLQTYDFSLLEIEETLEGSRFHPSALEAICQQILTYFQNNDIGAVRVFVAADQIGAQGVDLRTDTQAPLKIIVAAAPVGQIRTVHKEDSAAPEPYCDRRIRDGSPSRLGDLLAPEALEDYLFYVNRHPNRRVEMELGSLDRPNEVGLDFVITKEKPWRIYTNVANTGPKGLNQWQEVLGYINTQLTGHDDILQVDVATDSFNRFHSEMLSYRRPFSGAPRVSWKVQGNYAEFSSAQLGIMKKEFVGKQGAGSFEVYWNAYQHRDLFLDLFGAFQYRYINVDNRIFHQHGHQGFLLPTAGLELSQFRSTHRFYLRLEGLTTWNGITDVKQSEINRLGRPHVDKEWLIFRQDGYVSFFLEPLFASRKGDCPFKQYAMLANEMNIGLHCQYVGSKRLIPELQSVVGGLYSVRGYPTAITAGDNTIVANVEYLLHVPQLFKYKSEQHTKLFGQPFKWMPQHPGGKADWDFIIRTFFDVGHATNNGPHQEDFHEPNETLLGTGFGADLIVRQNFFLRTDYSWALKKAESIPNGHFEFYLSGTLMY